MEPKDILAAFRAAIAEHATDEGWQFKKQEAFENNRWFTIENINQALNQWLEALSETHVNTWLLGFTKPDLSPKVVGIIMAGNVPLVGMHDLLCALVSGYKVKVKTSSDDEILPQFWLHRTLAAVPELKSRIEFSENLKEVDMAIATGSNNSARYFEYYFRNMPHLLRKNRNSVAILNGDETPEELNKLGYDVFDYYGLGCRNVTHLYLPMDYAFKPLFDAWEPFSEAINHHKYANNYNYHKALLLLNLDPHMDTGYLLLKEKPEIYSPVGMLNYSFYSDANELHEHIQNHQAEIQCIVSQTQGFGAVPLGEAQKTMLWDYADGVNTLEWFQKLK